MILFFTFLFILGTIGTAAQAADSTAMRWTIGGGLESGISGLSAFAGYPEAPRPLGIRVGSASFQLWRFSVNGNVYLSPSFALHSRIGFSPIDYNFTDRERILIGINGVPTEGIIEHSLSVSYPRAEIELGGMFIPFERIGVSIGARAAFLGSPTVEQRQELVSPPGFRFVTPVPPYSGSPASQKRLFYEIVSRISWDVPFSTASGKWFIRPEIGFSTTLGSPLSSGPLRISSVTAGLQLMYSSTPFVAPTPPQRFYRDTVVIRDTITTLATDTSESIRFDSRTITEYPAADSMRVTILVREKYIKFLPKPKALLSATLKARLGSGASTSLLANTKEIIPVKATFLQLDSNKRVNEVESAGSYLLYKMVVPTALLTPTVISEAGIRSWNIGYYTGSETPNILAADSIYPVPDSIIWRNIAVLFSERDTIVKGRIFLTIQDNEGQSLRVDGSTLTFTRPHEQASPGKVVQTEWIILLSQRNLSTQELQQYIASLPANAVLQYCYIPSSPTSFTNSSPAEIELKNISVPVEPYSLLLPADLFTYSYKSAYILEVQTPK